MKKGLTVSEYLCHLGQAVLCANIETAKTARDLLAKGTLDGKVMIGDKTYEIDGASILPPGWFGLDELEIECESAVAVARDNDGNPVGLELTMSKGLLQRGMHVKFKAKFRRHGTVEGIEILRDTANQDLREQTKNEDLSDG